MGRDGLRLPIEVSSVQSFAYIEVDGKNTVTPLLISGTQDKILIGVITLEALGLMVDPTKGTLKETETLLLQLQTEC